MSNFIADVRKYIDRKLNPAKASAHDLATAELYERIWGEDPHAVVHRNFALPRLRGKPALEFVSARHKAASEHLENARMALENIKKEIDEIVEMTHEPQVGEPYLAFLQRIESASARKAWLESEALPGAQKELETARTELGFVQASEAEFHADKLYPAILEADKLALSMLLAAIEARRRGAELREEQRLWMNLVDSGERAGGLQPPARTAQHDILRLISKWALLDSIWLTQSDNKYEQFLVRLKNNFTPLLDAIKNDAVTPASTINADKEKGHGLEAAE